MRGEGWVLIVMYSNDLVRGGINSGWSIHTKKRGVPLEVELTERRWVLANQREGQEAFLNRYISSYTMLRGSAFFRIAMIQGSATTAVYGRLDMYYVILAILLRIYVLYVSYVCMICMYGKGNLVNIYKGALN